jgi:MFS family permease
LALRLGIWVALASAFAPIVLAMSLGGLLILWYAEGRWVRGQLVIAAVVPLLLLGPWLAQRALRPWRAWWEAGYPLPGSATVREVVLGRAGGPGAAPEWLTVGVLVLALVALVPRRTRTGVLLAWLVALLGLGAALVGTLVTYSTHVGPADITPWVGIPTVVWIGGLLTAVLLAVPAALSWPRPAIVAAIVVALVLPVGTAGWWLVRGADDPLADGRPNVVPVFLAERPGDTLVMTGSIDDGVDYRVVAGDGPFLGQEAVTASSSDSARLTAVMRRILAQATAADIDALGAMGIDSIYAPRADPELTRRIDAAPRLSPSGSDQPGSRVWTLAPQPRNDTATVPWWHRALIAVQALAWLVAIVLTAPVRRRAAPEPLGEGEEEEVAA